MTPKGLTDALVNKAKPRSKAYKLFDSGGMFLLVRPTGAKYWRLKYRFQGKENSLSLGVYPTISLEFARKQRDAAHALLAKGINPSELRKRTHNKPGVPLVMNSDGISCKGEYLECESEQASVAVTLDGKNILLRKEANTISFTMVEAEFLSPREILLSPKVPLRQGLLEKPSPRVILP